MPVELLDGQRLHVMMDLAPILNPSAATSRAGNDAGEGAGTPIAALRLGGGGVEGRKQRRIGVLLPRDAVVADLKGMPHAFRKYAVVCCRLGCCGLFFLPCSFVWSWLWPLWPLLLWWWWCGGDGDLCPRLGWSGFTTSSVIIYASSRALLSLSSLLNPSLACSAFQRRLSLYYSVFPSSSHVTDTFVHMIARLISSKNLVATDSIPPCI